MPNSEPPQQVWSVDVFLTADGRKIKTLQIPVTSTYGTGRVGSAPVVDILKLYGIDFLVLLDADNREIHGWQFKLQTAEQVCSMQQLDNSANFASAKIDSLESCFDILYQVLSKFTSQPALASGDCSQNLQTDQLTVLGPGAGAEDSLTSDLRSYIGELLSKLRLDTQKPALENLKLDAWLKTLDEMGDAMCELLAWKTCFHMFLFSGCWSWNVLLFQKLQFQQNQNSFTNSHSQSSRYFNILYESLYDYAILCL